MNSFVPDTVVPHAPPAHSEQARRVYIGNLSYEVKWHHLKDFMRQAGNVLFADVLLLPNGMSKGCGIVEYATAEDAQKAIMTLTNQKLMGRVVYVREDRESESRLGTAPGMKGRTGVHGERGHVQVSNTPERTTWRELKNFFLTTNGIPIENVGFVDAATNSCVVELLAQHVNAFVEAFNGVVYKDKMLLVERCNNPTVQYMGAGAGAGYNHFGPPKENMGMMPPQFIPKDPASLNNPLTEGVTSGGEPNNKIFVGNLPWATTREDLQDLFVTIGQVDDTGIVYNRAGRSSGSGVVQFNTDAEAADAINRFDGYLYGKRPLHLSYAKYRPLNIPLESMDMNMM